MAAVHAVTWEKGKSGAPNEEAIRFLELFLHLGVETPANAEHVFITPNSRSDEYLVPLTCLFPTPPVTRQVFLTTIVWITSATSSQRSVAFSRIW